MSVLCAFLAAVVVFTGTADTGGKTKDGTAPPAYSAPAPGPGECPKPSETPCAPGVWEYGGGV